MKSEGLQNAIGMIDFDLVERSKKPIKKKKRIKITAAIAAMLACAIGLGIFFGNQKLIDSTNNGTIPPVLHAVSVAQYPEMQKYPKEDSDFAICQAWTQDQIKRQAYFGASNGLEGFIGATASEILSGNGTANRVYSPMSLYMALAMTAELADGNTRAQILDLLGAESIEALRAQANGIWNANYNNDGAVTSILASSVWMDNDISYRKETLDRLAENYFASSYSGEMGSDSMNQALHDWLNEQTGGKLKNQIDNIIFNPQTVLGLATNVYFRAKWKTKFSKAKTEKDVFHGAEKDVTVDFMKQTEKNGTYYWGEHFSATSKPLEGSGHMLWILPDENVTTEMLLQDEELLSFISSEKKWENKVPLKVNLSVPRFDVSFDTDLIENLKNLGLTDCFSSGASDFSPMLENPDHISDLEISQIRHGARVSVDEEGIEATAYTTIMWELSQPSPPNDEIDFVVDRPYIFVITGEDGSVMFIGVVNQL